MDPIDILLNAVQNPLLYSLIFFIYVILAAIILPIPVEIGLFNPNLHPILLIIILALGKGAGALIVFYIGSGVRNKISGYSTKSTKITKFIKYCELFVRRYGNYGLFIIMSIPLMIDSVSLYFFSIVNPQDDGTKTLSATRFTLINIAAGALRGTIILLIAYTIGIRLI